MADYQSVDMGGTGDVTGNGLTFNDPHSGININRDTVQGGVLGLGQVGYNTFQADSSAWNQPDSRNYQGIINAHLSQLANRTPMQTQAASAGQAQAGQFRAAQGANSAGPNMREQGQFGDQQQGLANMLQAQANGQGPSLVQQQFKQQTDQGMAQQLALAASVHGNDPGMALRQASEGQAQVQAQAQSQAALNSQQERMNAISQLGGVLDQGRGQALAAQGLVQANNQFNAGQAQQNAQFNASNAAQMSQFNAGQQNQMAIQNAQFQQQANAENLAAAQQNQQQVDELSKQYLAMGYSMDQAKQQAAIDYQKFQVNSLAQQEGLKHDRAAAGNAAAGQAVGAGLAAAGTIAAAAM